MFSLIFQGFSGTNTACAEAFRTAFGERGAYHSLAVDRDKHIPCELAEKLTRDDAEAKAVILRDGGMTIAIVPTAEVAGVKHRAARFWPTHRASTGETFTDEGISIERGRNCFMI